MNVEDFRDYCLSLPGVSEGTPFEKFSRGRFTVLVFYVAGHMFCYCDIDHFTAITVKARAERIPELRERYRAVGPPFNGNPKHWIGVTLHLDMPDDEILALVRDAHRLVNSARGNRRD